MLAVKISLGGLWVISKLIFCLRLRGGRVLSESIFSAAGLGFLSTSYTGNPGKVALTGNFLGCVRNIRVKNPNHFMLLKK